MTDTKETMQRLSERMCGAYKYQKEFVEELEALMQHYPIDQKIRYDFRTKPVSENIEGDPLKEETAGRRRDKLNTVPVPCT